VALAFLRQLKVQREKLSALDNYTKHVWRRNPEISLPYSLKINNNDIRGIPEQNVSNFIYGKTNEREILQILEIC
jgi:hypothetical protein